MVREELLGLDVPVLDQLDRVLPVLVLMWGQRGEIPGLRLEIPSIHTLFVREKREIVYDILYVFEIYVVLFRQRPFRRLF